MASRETSLRAGDSAGFCFGWRRPAGFGSSVPAPPKKDSPWSGEQAIARLYYAPQEAAARKGENVMTEEIKVPQTAEEAPCTVPSIPQGYTGSAGSAPEIKNRKPLVSWAALLEEAVTKPGYIHEAYSRFWNYSILC